MDNQNTKKTTKNDYLLITYNIYKELEEMYNYIIKKISKLFKDIDITNPVELTQGYNKLLYNGAFSKNKKFIFNYGIETIDIREMLGIDIMNGKGVCRHTASLLSDIASNLDYETRTIKVKYGKYNIDYRKYNMSKLETCILNMLKYISANHMITQISTNKFNYIIDPTNEHYLKYIKNSKYVDIIDEDIIMKQKKIYFLIEILMGIYIDKVIDERKMNDRLLLPTLDKEELIYLKEQANKKINCQINEKFINNVYNQNKINYDEICKLANDILHIWNSKNIPKTKVLKR